MHPPLIWPMDMSYRQEFDLIITAIPSIPIHKSLWNRNLSKDEQVHTIPPVLVTGDQYHHSLISLWSFQLSELICNPSCFLFLVQPIASAAFKKWHFLQMAFMRWSSRSHKKVKGQSQGWQRTLFLLFWGPFLTQKCRTWDVASMFLWSCRFCLDSSMGLQLAVSTPFIIIIIIMIIAIYKLFHFCLVIVFAVNVIHINQQNPKSCGSLRQCTVNIGVRIGIGYIE